MNPNDIFWLASYAHRQLSPLMEPMDAYLKMDLRFGGNYPGVDVWIHRNDPSELDHGVVAYRTAMQTQQEMDKFIAALQPLEVGIAA